MDEDSPIGDLARDTFRDSEWTGRSADSLAKLMSKHNPCIGAWVAFKSAKKAYAEYSGNIEASVWELVDIKLGRYTDTYYYEDQYGNTKEEYESHEDDDW